MKVVVFIFCFAAMEWLFVHVVNSFYYSIRQFSFISATPKYCNYVFYSMESIDDYIKKKQERASKLKFSLKVCTQVMPIEYSR